MNPHSKFVQSWTKFFALSCLLAIFIDPLFFFLILVNQVLFFFSLYILLLLMFLYSCSLQIIFGSTAERQMHCDRLANGYSLCSCQKCNRCFILCKHSSSGLCSQFYLHFVYKSKMAFNTSFLQFRLAYVAPESTVVGAGQLVDHPRKIARHYFRGKFLLDLFIVMPIPQVHTV